jgi:hypothetical protein
MSDRPSEPPISSEQNGGRNGLCDTCAHQQEVRNTRGSVFSLCTRSREDQAYPRYPRVPVVSCRGFELKER